MLDPEREKLAVDALQKLHEEIQMNADESAGYCWLEFLQEALRSHRMVLEQYGGDEVDVIRHFLKMNGYDPSDYGLEASG